MEKFVQSISEETAVFHTIFIDPNLNSVLKAIALQKEGLNCMIVFKNDLPRNDNFRITRFFPLNIFEIRKLLKEYKIWKNLMELAPHLFQSQKVIYSVQNRSGIIKSALADYFYGNQYHQKSKILIEENQEKFPFVQDKKLSFVAFHEYQFNTNRFLIELLKYFQHSGGSVRVDEPFYLNDKSFVFNHPPKNIKAKEILADVPRLKPGFLLPVKTFNNFVFVVAEKGIAIRYVQTGDKLFAEQIKPAFPELPASQIIEFSRNYFSFDHHKILHKKISEPPGPETTQKFLTVLGDLSHCTFEGSDMEDHYEICLEKYDLAKQTGISYNTFKAVYHRYGKGIDEIIETAYELLNKMSDPDKIWNRAELLFQQKYEWRKLKNDEKNPYPQVSSDNLS